MLKLSDSISVPTEYLKIYSPLLNFREVYKCFNKEISVMWRIKVLPVSLPPKGSLSQHYNIFSRSKVAKNIVTYLSG
jgi:hypothetical protein